ncbi:MAG: glycoside hydrolase family 16 protein, partial [Fibrobacteraceae bacterium]
MKTLPFALAAIALMATVPQVFAENWTLVWSDEFDGNGLPDASKWSYDEGGGGWGNGELEYYTASRVENASVANGVLSITARKEAYRSNAYTSARLVTRGKGDWLYGKVEVKAKLPRGRGMWPAIWMLPTDWEYGDWPKSGELDIMENVGYDSTYINSNIHTQAYNHSIGTNKGNRVSISDPWDTWHVYKV